MTKTIVISSILLLTQAAAALPIEAFSPDKFQQAVQKKESFVVGIHAPWCGSCRIQKPNLERVVNEEPLEKVRAFMADFESSAAFRSGLEKPVRSPSTILVYKDTEIKRQLITLRELNGPRTKVGDLEKLLVDLGALKESDVRLKKRSDSMDDDRKDDDLNVEDYDDDWD